MIDNAFLITKIVFGVIGVFLVYSGREGGKLDRLVGGVMLFLVAGFMTGAEMVTDSEQPWAYLILTGSEQDWSTAFFGGTTILILPVLLLAVGGKNLAKIIEQK